MTFQNDTSQNSIRQNDIRQNGNRIQHSDFLLNDTMQNDTQQSDIYEIDTDQNDSLCNVSEQNNIKFIALQTTFIIMTFFYLIPVHSFCPIFLRVTLESVILLNVLAPLS